jgi:hypothetical protein
MTRPATNVTIVLRMNVSFEMDVCDLILMSRSHARHALARFGAAPAHLCAGGHPQVIGHSLAIFGAATTDGGTGAAGVDVQF